MKRLNCDMLSVDEKLRLLCAADRWSTYDANGKLPTVKVSDGPVGRRIEGIDKNGMEYSLKGIAYPSLSVLANTWCDDLARDMGECLACDAIDGDIDIMLAPGVNIKRSPLCGRNFEYFGEDPYLAGCMAREYISGLQNNGVGACLKHFCCNNTEFNRRQLSSEVDERTLREIYLEAFKIACEAKPVSIMSSYNRINGINASEFKHGFDILREEFGFDGIVFSDWHSVKDRARAVKAGLDIEFPFYAATYDKLVGDYNAGLISDCDIDRCVERILTALYRVADMKKKRRITKTETERKIVARDIAADGAVLLKNDGLLPLKQGVKVCVNGSYGKPECYQIAGGGSSYVEYDYGTFDLAALLRARLGVDVPFSKCYCPTSIDGIGDDGCIPEIGLNNALSCDINIVCVGTGAALESEGEDRRSLRLPEAQERFILHSAELNPNTAVVIFAGSSVDMSAWIDKVKAVLYAGFCGPSGGDAVADILCGTVNPSGKLSESFPLNIDVAPSERTYRDMNVSCYSEGLNVGYRHYDRQPKDIAFPFGFGLSYSEFKYSDLRIEKTANGITVDFDITNTSAMDGKETAQVYVSEKLPKVYRPLKELKGYAKKLIAAGKTEHFSVKLSADAFKHFSVGENKWTADDGMFEICVGASSRDIRLSTAVSVGNGEIHIL